KNIEQVPDFGREGMFFATARAVAPPEDRKSTRLNSSHVKISYAVFCLKNICEYPQSRERISGRVNLQALRSYHPGRPFFLKIGRPPGSTLFPITAFFI